MTWENKVRPIYDALVAEGYPLPDCLVVSDEPSGDFGIAHASFHNDCAYMSFDDAYEPTQHTILHEIGHVFQFANPDILEAFWGTAGISTTIVTSNAIAKQLQDEGQAYQSWRHWAVEIFADFFAWHILNDWVQIQTYNVRLSAELRASLTELFSNWSSELARLDSDDLQNIATMIDARVRAAETNILKEIVGALKSGFNETLPALLNRLAAGDKDVSTSALDR